MQKQQQSQHTTAAIAAYKNISTYSSRNTCKYLINYLMMIFKNILIMTLIENINNTSFSISAAACKGSSSMQRQQQQQSARHQPMQWP